MGSLVVVGSSVSARLAALLSSALSSQGTHGDALASLSWALRDVAAVPQCLSQLLEGSAPTVPAAAALMEGPHGWDVKVAGAGILRRVAGDAVGVARVLGDAGVVAAVERLARRARERLEWMGAHEPGGGEGSREVAFHAAVLDLASSLLGSARSRATADVLEY